MARVVASKGLDELAFCEFARDVAASFSRIDFVAVSGDLGVGKTTFCRNVVQLFSKDEFIGSPTYDIVHYYQCDGFVLAHVDLYRVESIKEAENAGILDLIGQHLLLVEWPGILLDAFVPDVRIEISDHKGSSNLRDVVVNWNRTSLSSDA